MEANTERGSRMIRPVPSTQVPAPLPSYARAVPCPGPTYAVSGTDELLWYAASGTAMLETCMCCRIICGIWLCAWYAVSGTSI
eukprot:1070044-Rhodomonas_salina.1